MKWAVGNGVILCDSWTKQLIGFIDSFTIGEAS
jgi:hypothetical protein